MPNHMEFRVFEFIHTGHLAAGNIWRATAEKLSKPDEVGEIVFAEVVSPVAPGGAEDLVRWYPVTDGKAWDEYLNMSPFFPWNMTPEKRVLLEGGNPVAFGDPIITARKAPAAEQMLRATCPKFNESLAVHAWAGDTDVNNDFKIRLWCMIYPSEQLSAIRPLESMPYIGDVARQRQIPLSKSSMPVTYQTWRKLPGGTQQEGVKVYPFLRFAENHAATTPNFPYSFQVRLGNIAGDEPWKELYWELSGVEDCLIIKGIGVRADAPGHLYKTYMRIGGYDHPKNGIFTELGQNPLHFGHAFPIAPLDSPWFVPIPKLQTPHYIHDEIGEIVILDDGTAIVAEDVVVAMNGALVTKEEWGG